MTTTSIDPAPGNDTAGTTLDVRVPPAPALEPHLAFTRQPFAGSADAGIADVPARGGPYTLARLLVDETVTTTDDQVLRPDERHPAYSPDGTRLAFSTHVLSGGILFDRRLAVGDLAAEPVPLGEPAVTDLRLLSYPAVPGTSDVEPVWSPDGTRIAFLRHDSQYDDLIRGLYVLEVDSGQLTEVPVPEDVGSAATSPSWAPDGDRLAVQVLVSESEELWVVHLDDGSWYPVGVPVPGCTEGRCVDAVPGVAPVLQPRHQHSPMGKTIAGCYSPIPHEGATSGQNLSGGSG